MKKVIFIALGLIIILLTGCTSSPVSGEPDSSSSSGSGSKSGGGKGEAPEVSLYDYECGHYYIRVKYKVESKAELTDYQIYYGENSKCKKKTSTVKSGDYIRSSITCGDGETYYFKAVVSNQYGETESSVTKLTSKEK